MFLTVRELHQMRRTSPRSVQSHRPCSTCGLYLAARNLDRHRKACAKRKREDLAGWTEWRNAMRGE